MRSLRVRLAILFALLSASTLAAGGLMVALFEQSATARRGQAQAELGRACDAIGGEYRVFASGWKGLAGDPETDSALRASLIAVLKTALGARVGVEGGFRRNGAASLAYAYPTYQGAGPKTDEPAAEMTRIAAVNKAALDDERPVVERFEAPAQILLIAACPLGGPIAGLTAWTMTRVNTFADASYQLLMAGIVVLFVALVAAAILLARLATGWSRHVGAIEASLQAHDVADLPRLAPTGERELDRIVTALNDLGERLDAARRDAEDLAGRIASDERLTALGRVAAGLAHEIRNPIAAMRLRAETALDGDPPRRANALAAIVAQIDRLDALVSRVLSSTSGEGAAFQEVDTAALLRAAAGAARSKAKAKDVRLEMRSEAAQAAVDPKLMREALENLLVNAIEASPPGARVELSAERRAGSLVFAVRDQGPGVAPEMRARLFEPFASGRPEGAGLGLAVVREIAKSHQGVARLADSESGALFEIVLPCPSS